MKFFSNFTLTAVNVSTTNTPELILCFKECLNKYKYAGLKPKLKVCILFVTIKYIKPIDKQYFLNRPFKTIGIWQIISNVHVTFKLVFVL